MPSTPRHYQQLQPEERVTLASLVQQKFGVREMAGMLNGSPSTISRELNRNAGAAGYVSAQAREPHERVDPASIKFTSTFCLSLD